MALYIALAVVLLAVYIVWLCLEMAYHVAGGDALLLEVAAAMAVGSIAGAIGLVHWRRGG